jgi:uncharacterized RDD family membrane protein YckC
MGHITVQLRTAGRLADVLCFPRSHWNSAAQNSPVIRICSKCGALLFDDSEGCSFCEPPALQNSDVSVPVPMTADDFSESEEPEWRQEVSRRLEQYRVRRGRVAREDSQSGLPFHEPVRVSEVEEEVIERRPVRVTPRQRPLERFDINVQPELDFANSPHDRARPQTALVPVASLTTRQWAGVIDALFLILTCAGFLGLFRSLGGQIVMGKTDGVVYLTVFYIFYGLYFFLFTTLAGATPGMQFCRLSVVRLDGSLPDTRQLAWRTFGYLLSGATLMLGFVWSVWDEDHFTWHDRISQTYVTAAAPLSDLDLTDRSARQRTFAPK